MKQTLFLFLSLLLFFSCAVQKRKYQKGYYIGWSKSLAAKKEKARGPAAGKSTQPDLAATHLAAHPQLAEQAAASFQKKEAEEPVATAKSTIKPSAQSDEPCDDLIFRDGSEVKGKVSEVNATEIKYKKCDMPDGPVYTVKKSEVFMIKYANGTREVFKEEAKPNPEKPKTPPLKRVHPMAITALILGIASFVVFFIGLLGSILAIVLADIAIERINRQPDVYEGLVLAKIGKILGIIYLVILAIVLLFVFLAFASLI